MSTILFAIVALLIGYWGGYYIGWLHARDTVAKECDRLGSFYVGKKGYPCTQIKEASE